MNVTALPTEGSAAGALKATVETVASVSKPARWDSALALPAASTGGSPARCARRAAVSPVDQRVRLPWVAGLDAGVELAQPAQVLLGALQLERRLRVGHEAVLRLLVGNARGPGRDPGRGSPTGYIRSGRCRSARPSVMIATSSRTSTRPSGRSPIPATTVNRPTRCRSERPEPTCLPKVEAARGCPGPFRPPPVKDSKRDRGHATVPPRSSNSRRNGGEVNARRQLASRSFL